MVQAGVNIMAAKAHRSDAARLAKVDGQAITVATMGEAIAETIARTKAGPSFCFFTLNLDHLVKRRDNAAFRDAYRKADIVSADGAPVAVIARRQSPRIERVTGADLVKPLVIAAAEQGIPIGLFGTSGAVLALSAARMKEWAPGLDVVFSESPKLGFDPTAREAEEAGLRMQKAGAKLVFIALGAPKQELFAAHMAERTRGIGFICIGAALDFIAGTQPRSPVILRALGMEWAWRLITNPRRMARRYAACAMLLVRLAAPQKRHAQGMPR